MRTPDRNGTSARDDNIVAPSPQKGATGRSTTKGEVPPGLLDRYLIERDRQGRPERFYRDHRAVDPMFRDEGKKLVAGQSYPDTIADMMKIAQHRSWTQVRVTGDEAFRREAWIQARTLGIEVKGYKPRDRDRQAAGDRSPPAPPSRDHVTGSPVRLAEQRLKDAAVVVRRLISDPAAQARLIERAYEKVRGGRPQDFQESQKSRAGRSENDRARR